MSFTIVASYGFKCISKPGTGFAIVAKYGFKCISKTQYGFRFEFINLNHNNLGGHSESPTEITGVRGKFPVATIAVLLQSTLGSVDGSVYYTYISKSGMGFAIAAKYWSNCIYKVGMGFGIEANYWSNCI